MICNLSSKVPQKLLQLRHFCLRPSSPVLLPTCSASRVVYSTIFPMTEPRTYPGTPVIIPSAIQCKHVHTTSISQSSSKITVPVPTMGDSITEGTIVEWVAQVGQAVNEGDVIALIETDKVTVDIKADKSGVLMEQLGAVDEAVEVGQGLYVMDTDALASVSAGSERVDPPNESSEYFTETTASSDDQAEPESRVASSRVPSIHFLGKEGWKARLSAIGSASPAAVSNVNDNPSKPHLPSSTSYVPYDSLYGRPPITDDEMDALILGGAEEAPEMYSVVSKEGMGGVVFKGGKVVTAGPRGVWLAKEGM